MTQEFWLTLPDHTRLCSELTLEELRLARPGLRDQLLALTENFSVIKITDEMRALADQYLKGGVVPARYYADALHIAAAVHGEADILVSWNFKHLVRRRTRLLVNFINVQLGLRTLEILAPPEV